MSRLQFRFYFVCLCGAKFFTLLARASCPRCDRFLSSSEQLPVPWYRVESNREKAKANTDEREG